MAVVTGKLTGLQVKVGGKWTALPTVTNAGLGGGDLVGGEWVAPPKVVPVRRFQLVTYSTTPTDAWSRPPFWAKGDELPDPEPAA